MLDGVNNALRSSFAGAHGQRRRIMNKLMTAIAAALMAMAGGGQYGRRRIRLP